MHSLYCSIKHGLMMCCKAALGSSNHLDVPSARSSLLLRARLPHIPNLQQQDVQFVSSAVMHNGAVVMGYGIEDCHNSIAVVLNAEDVFMSKRYTHFPNKVPLVRFVGMPDGASAESYAIESLLSRYAAAWIEIAQPSFVANGTCGPGMELKSLLPTPQDQGATAQVSNSNSAANNRSHSARGGGFRKALLCWQQQRQQRTARPGHHMSAVSSASTPIGSATSCGAAFVGAAGRHFHTSVI
jgi:hypothetical protein